MDYSEMLAGRFALERKIGSGGMARVYVGRDEVLGRQVAVKVLRPGLAGTDTSERFRREGSMAARLSHPNIVPVYDAGVAELDGRDASYIVMEYVSGGDLKDRIRGEGALDAVYVCRIGAGAAGALAHAHSHGVVHRDVKPHNILLDAAGVPKLTDFGIARALEGTHHTRTGNFLGTALYSAPEQLRGAEISGKTDVYSLGTALYEAVTGEPPFSGTVVEVAEKHFSKIPTRPRTDDGLADIILACLEKDPEDRPAADELAERLSGIAEDRQRSPVAPAAPPPPLPKEEPAQKTATMGTFKRRRRSRKPLAFVCVIALLVLGGAGIYLSGYDLPGGGEEQAASQDSSQSASQNVAQNPSQNGSQSESQDASQNVASNGSSGNSSNQTSENDSIGSGSESGSREDAAVGAVRELYQTAADEDYDRSYALLSEEFRTAVAPTREAWTGQFATLESVRFVGTPQVEVIGDTATVSGETIAIHSNRTDRTDAVWTLIREDGEWKLDDLLAQPSA